MEMLIGNTIQFMMFAVIGSYFGYKLRKKEDPETKFNWSLLALTQSAIILGGVAAYFSFID